MPRKLPRYVQGFIDRNGHVRHYLRKRGTPRIAIPGLVWSREFMAIYHDALLGLSTLEQLPEERTVSPVLTGSFGAALDAYYVEPAKRSDAYVALSQLTQDVYRRELERLRKPHGVKALTALKIKHYTDMVDLRAVESVSGAAQLVKALRSFGKFTVKGRLLRVNPVIGLEAVEVMTRRDDVTREAGHRTWTVSEMDQFKRHHKPGTKARLAFELVLGLGQRRSDAITVGPCNVVGGYDPAKMTGTSVRFVQVKNRKNNPVTLVLPLLPVLAEELQRHPVPLDAPAFLLRDDGRPYTARRFNDDFARWVREAGINSPLVPHGLRKSAATRLAGKRATPHMIASVTGHRSLREVERYTAAVDQEDLARDTLALLTDDETPEA